jgi:hypothetical protein
MTCGQPANSLWKINHQSDALPVQGLRRHLRAIFVKNLLGQRQPHVFGPPVAPRLQESRKRIRIILALPFSVDALQADADVAGHLRRLCDAQLQLSARADTLSGIQ